MMQTTQPSARKFTETGKGLVWTKASSEARSPSLRSLVAEARRVVALATPDLRHLHAVCAVVFEEYRSEASPAGAVREWRGGAVVKSAGGTWVRRT
jgi:hypothetical protein